MSSMLLLVHIYHCWIHPPTTQTNCINTHQHVCLHTEAVRRPTCVGSVSSRHRSINHPLGLLAIRLVLSRVLPFEPSQITEDPCACEYIVHVDPNQRVCVSIPGDRTEAAAAGCPFSQLRPHRPQRLQD